MTRIVGIFLLCSAAGCDLAPGFSPRAGEEGSVPNGPIFACCKCTSFGCPKDGSLPPCPPQVDPVPKPKPPQQQN